MNLPLAFIGGMGYGEMLLVGFIALLLFGKKLPEVARSLGKGVTEFKKGVQGIEEEIRETTQYNELPHSTEPQTPQAPKFEPPSTPPTDAESVSGGDETQPTGDQPNPEDRPTD
jgi:sec-independent protein translocase protein TatA